MEEMVSISVISLFVGVHNITTHDCWYYVFWMVNTCRSIHPFGQSLFCCEEENIVFHVQGFFVGEKQDNALNFNIFGEKRENLGVLNNWQHAYIH